MLGAFLVLSLVLGEVLFALLGRPPRGVRPFSASFLPPGGLLEQVLDRVMM